MPLPVFSKNSCKLQICYTIPFSVKACDHCLYGIVTRALLSKSFNKHTHPWPPPLPPTLSTPHHHRPDSRSNTRQCPSWGHHGFGEGVLGVPPRIAHEHRADPLQLRNTYILARWTGVSRFSGEYVRAGGSRLSHIHHWTWDSAP